MTYSKILLFAVFPFFPLILFGQEGIDYDLKKPAKFENRVLASEKSNNGKKLSKSRRFVQNTVTHYNYYYNANVKIEAVIARAKSRNKDDYTRLLTFYNYSLDNTASQKTDLDSIIYKCTMGILIHDTRNDWIDNLYVLIGRTYYLKKDFDSAFISFQFSNYAFAPHDKDGTSRPVGSNFGNDEGSPALMVSTEEKRNVLQKVFSLPPSRNEALVWKIRVYLAKNQYAEAASLIEVLKHDPQFPPRLAPDLAEVQALYFYKQSINDSAAYYLEKALPLAEGGEEKARWEYLIAQLYERAYRTYEAKTFYERTIRHTYNPVLEVYARLNAIRQNRNSIDTDIIQKNIDALAKMSKKDRYEPYRDIIYYTAAQMELERDNRPGAETLLRYCTRATKSPEAASGDLRDKAFLQLANMSFEDKKYKAAKNYYDSLNLNNLTADEKSLVSDRRTALKIIVEQLLVLERQDSLQRIASMPPDQRDAYIKKLVKSLRKQRGLKEEDQDGTGFSVGNNNNANVPDLFSNSQASGDWYFNNPSLKSKGYSDFRNKWGNRPNVDNWQLSSLASQQKLTGREGQRITPVQPDLDGKNANPSAGLKAITFTSLLDNLPLTPDKIKKMNDSVENALLVLGKGYQEGIADYLSAITAYDTLLSRFSGTRFREETLFNLYYCYAKTGDADNAARILAMMKNIYPDGWYTARAANPDSTMRAAGRLKTDATHQYEKIYTSFIEGRFDEAIAEKRTADSLYGDKYWTPQLLYIASVYFIRSGQDSQAKVTLSNIQAKFPNTPMAAKAATLLDVLSRRRQIEDYLTNLKITRAVDSTDLTANQPGRAAEDTTQLARARIHIPSPSGKPKQQAPSAAPGRDKLQVDPANLAQIKIDAEEIARLKKRYDSLRAAMKKAYDDSLALVRSNKLSDSLKQVALAALKRRNDSVRAVLEQLKTDSMQLASRIRSLNSAFAYTPEKAHSVMIVMEKVDPVYVTETGNAFHRYNQENYYSLSLTTEKISVNDSLKFVVIGHFGNADSAMQYLRQAKALAPRQIVSWLPANKYSFLIISGQNLDLLLSNKDIEAYRKFFSAAYPGK